MPGPDDLSGHTAPSMFPSETNIVKVQNFRTPKYCCNHSLKNLNKGGLIYSREMANIVDLDQTAPREYSYTAMFA